MARPYWSGQIQISLVSFAVKFFVATESKSEIRFHQISRSTGERVRHQKVSAGDDAPVEKEEIVKGYEYRKGEYIAIEPSEIEHLRIESKHSIAVTQCVDVKEIAPQFFEKPYFVVPDGENQAEAFAVIRTALAQTKKAALGKIAFGGREHVIALMAPDGEEQTGMMAYTLRYAEELRDATEYFRDVKAPKIEADQLELAQELIKRKAAPFKPEEFKDEYEAALRELVEAKIKHEPVPQDEPAPKRAKVVNLMDALRESLGAKKEPAKAVAAKEEAPAKSAATKAAKRKGPTLVKSATAKGSAPAKSATKRKSA